MAHDYGVPLRILSVTPTRDNIEAPGGRMPDKHTRLFCDKTLDEWLMIQLWSSHHDIKAVFVCETEKHRGRLQPLADKYGVELMVRPPEMLHPINDSGALPVYWGVLQALQKEYYSLLMTPMVVAPCRPPGFFDYFVDQYQLKVAQIDDQHTSAILLGAYQATRGYYDVHNGHGEVIKSLYAHGNPAYWEAQGNHWIAATWWYLADMINQFGRMKIEPEPTMVEIKPWMDIHIDTEDHWAEAEFWFKRKILSEGEDCYARYRRNIEDAHLREGSVESTEPADGGTQRG